MLRKLLGVLVAFFSFVVFILLVVIGLTFLWPEYKSAGLVVNFIFLSIAFALSFKVYGKITKKDDDDGDVETDKAETNHISIKNETDNLDKDSYSYGYEDIVREGKNADDVFVSSESEPKSGMGTGVKIVIGLVALIAIALVGLLAIGMFVGDDLANPNVFNDSNISFSYPSDWVRGNDSDLYLVLEGDNVVLNINISSSEGFSVDDIADEIVLEANGSNGKVLFKNVTNVGDVKAYDIGLYVNKDGGFQARFLVFVANDKAYIFAFNCLNLEDINQSFNLIKSSIKIN